MEIWGIVFRDDRGKNTQTLFDLELSSIDRKSILKNLTTKDFSEGPLEDKIFKGTDMWVFGKKIKSEEVYIKITLGIPNAQVICISFHISEYPIKFPYQ